MLLAVRVNRKLVVIVPGEKCNCHSTKTKKFLVRREDSALSFTMIIIDSICFDRFFSACDGVISDHGSDSKTDTTEKLSLKELKEQDEPPQVQEPSQSMVTTRSKCKYHRLFSLVTD